MNRRSILGILAGTPLVGQAVAQEAFASLRGSIPPATPPNGWGGSAQAVGQNMGNMVAEPLMKSDRALRLIFSDAAALAEIRSEIFDQQRQYSTNIDPDIMVLKSLSPMAKITFQRQRNVERELADLQEERWDRPQKYVRALQSRVQKLMWGK